MAERRNVLLLGGTGEARQLAATLDGRPDIMTISSLAGRTRDPASIAGRIREGGFGGRHGLQRYLEEEAVFAVVDATHPYAATITENAISASHRAGIPYLRLERPPWRKAENDRWVQVRNADAAADALKGLARRVLLTTGVKDLPAFSERQGIWFLVRLIEQPAEPIPLARYELLLTRGPFNEADETSLMKERRIEALVTKNSGGEATYAKILAAKRLDLPVIMIERPETPPCERVSTVGKALNWIERILV
jgi:precorrin-6A/cobalt-precorrin-6A reductase